LPVWTCCVGWSRLYASAVAALTAPGEGWAMTASGSGQRAVSANGWNTRLYWLWIWYNAIAFVTV
jgi:hypothetical protein